MKNYLSKAVVIPVALVALSASSHTLFSKECYSSIASYSQKARLLEAAIPSSTIAKTKKILTNAEFESQDAISLRINEELIISINCGSTVIINGNQDHQVGVTSDNENILVPGDSSVVFGNGISFLYACDPIALGKTKLSITYSKDGKNVTKELIVSVISSELGEID